MTARRLLALLPLTFTAAFGLGSMVVTPTAAQEATTLIWNGRLLDGSGNPWIYADVLIRGDRIEAVGDLSDVEADEVIDATGLYVAPGFIDSHSHAGGGLASAGLSHAEPLLAMGLTTVFVNPDGGGPADMAAQHDALMANGLGVNVAQLVPQGSVRRAVMGSADRAATPSELARMREIVQEAMETGAWGLSSGTYYVPGSYTPPEEIEELAKIVAEFGGAYTSHIRDESTYSVGLIAAVDEVINVGRVAGIPAVLTHVKALGPFVWGYGDAIVKRVERAREEGVQVFADQYPYTASATGLDAALLPRWSQAGGRDSLMARMDHPATMARIREGMVDGLARRGGADRIQFRRFRPDPSIEGRLLSDLAEERGEDPIDTAIELIRDGGVSIVSFNMHEDDLERLMAQPWTMTSSDGDLVPMGEGVPHPRTYGAFARKIGLYARDLGVVSLEEAVRSMTSLPALVFGMADRGVLREGAAADIVVFDLAAVDDVAEYTDPHHYSEGMVHVLVNGVPAISEGDFTGERPGQVLKK
ncbi:MAG: D-aminoacylase [Gemmatimonadetes bacterium]|nr:D-aminoacylase [Gemmatimonadota bacterium]NNF12347.1 D-aminoacylase [Gemmatimonadota bacterium]NNL30753.1 D-aminoacylase [Gemmatimonadota bacterium]